MGKDTSNILTTVGVVLIACALVDEITSNVATELEKLASGEASKQIPLLVESKEKESHEEKSKEKDGSQDEIAELKRKLAEFEQKEKDKQAN